MRDFHPSEPRENVTFKIAQYILNLRSAATLIKRRADHDTSFPRLAVSGRPWRDDAISMRHVEEIIGTT